MQEIENLVKRYIKPGFEYELFFQRTRKTKIDVSDENLENLSRSEEVGVGIRVLKDKRIGFAYATNPSQENVEDIVKKAMEMCELQNPDPGNAFLEKLEKSSVQSTYDREGVNLPLEDKIEFVLNLEKKAKETDARIKGVRKTNLTEGVFELSLKNSFGVEFSYEGTYYTAMISPLAQSDGDSAISWEFRGARRLSEIDPEDLVQDAVFKSVSLLNPQPLQTKVMPVVFFRESSAMLLEVFSAMFLGDAYVKGKTLLKDKVGESVANELLTVIDDGTLEGGFMTTPYDAEGVPRKRNTVIEKGIFKGFLHSLYTANLSNQEPTGNSERGSFRSLPSSGITNLFLQKGSVSLQEMLSSEEEAFLVLELMGLHTVDPISGEFSLGASGVLYRRGKPAHAVRGVTVAGNVLDLWNKIIAVGSDFKFYGNIGSPSVLAKDITVGGN
ncbi:MAG: TldD/PmbA family protein [Aquificae bacterium]|nr:TldD/PmbA family protein [Aquificota bacterium]